MPLGQQLSGRAELHKLRMVQHGDAVVVDDSTEPVGDRENRAAWPS